MAFEELMIGGVNILPALLGWSLVVLALKGWSLWNSAQAKKKVWFVCLLILNTLGILPAIYLIFFRRKK